MDVQIFNRFQVTIDRKQLLKSARVEDASDDGRDLERLCQEAESLADPKVLFKLAFVDETGDDFVVLDGVRFCSRVLRVNLGQVSKVVPYVATCGRQLEDWSRQIDDFIWQYWADLLKQMAMRIAVNSFRQYLIDDLQLGKIATMNPGSLEDWPIEEQRPLFSLLGDPKETIGVELSDSCLMTPSKSVSGIFFSTEEDYKNCQLCPREVCSGRQVPYDQELFEKKYHQKAGGK